MKRRFLCICLALAVLLGMTVTVFADDTTALQQMMLESFNSDKMLDIREYEMGLEEVLI